MRSRLRSLWRNLIHRGRADRDLDEEVASVFDLAVEEKIRAGLDPAKARRQALLATRLEMRTEPRRKL